MPTFTLNFSRPGNQIVGQYYNFVRLGRDGYTRIMEALRDIADAPVGAGSPRWARSRWSATAPPSRCSPSG